MKWNPSRIDHSGPAVRRERLRNKDGTFRRGGSSKDTQRTIIARWVEEEVALRRRFAEGSFAKIAGLVVAAVRGRTLPRVRLPAGVKFPDNYTLSGRGALKAFARYRAREKTRRANRKGTDFNAAYETQASSPAQTSKLQDQPRTVRLELRPRQLFPRASLGYVNLGIFDLGGRDPEFYEVLDELLWHFSARRVEPPKTKTTLEPDVVYTADPKFEEIRQVLTTREQQQLAKIWERGRQRALKKSAERERRKSRIESLSKDSEVPAKAAGPSGPGKPQKTAGQVRPANLSQSNKDRAAASFYDEV